MNTRKKFSSTSRVVDNQLLPVLIVGAMVFLSTPNFSGTTVQAQEHPKEHPSSAKKSALTPAALAKEITQYIEQETKLKGNYFLLYDEKEGKALVLSLDKVHKDKLSKVAEGTYFACSDFKSKDGKTYDLDFFLKESDSGLQVSEITVHKEDGKARYGWVEEKGIWKQQEKK